jgi:hypothetical protein
VSDEREVLYAEAVLGRDAEEFLAGDLGRYMVGRAQMEEREAVEALATVWPWRRRRIQQLQNQLWRARSFRAWLAELVNSGHQAEDQLEELAEQ